MSDGTKIEWTDATWNVVNGCSVVSPGCTNCYAMKQAHRFPARQGLTRKTNGGMVWTGEVRFNEAVLLHPLRWTRPRKIFVCAHGDLFHEKVPDEWIDRVFAVMALAHRHTFQVLTKRPERMLAYLRDDKGRDIRIHDIMEQIDPIADTDACEPYFWPLPNVWLGTSVEDQARADERIPILLDTPATVRWLSCEPLLGLVDLRPRPRSDLCIRCGEGPDGPHDHPDGYRTRGLDWIVAGGESGPGARPMHPDWARSLRDQCAAAGVPFLFKQWGDWAPGAGSREQRWVETDGRSRPAAEALPSPPSIVMTRLGKKASGRLLDGVQHDGYPA